MWNLFKAQLIAEYTPTTFNFADLNKVGKHGRYTESLYRRHIDITSGGLIVPRPDVPLVFEAVSLIYSNQNRFNVNTNSKLLSSQLRFDHTYYWTARIIDSPTAIIITLFPGIWTDMFFSPNFGAGSRVWVNALSMSMYLQKNTVIGIRISKIPPYFVTPWSGALFKTFDSGFSASALVGSIMSIVRAEINLLSAIVFDGNPNALDSIISSYESLYSSVITQNLINSANQIPAIYGDDFRGIDLKNNSGDVEKKVLGNISDLCSQFLAQVISASQAKKLASGETIKGLTILTGVLGLDILKKEWIEKNKNKNTIVIDYNEVRFRVAKEYYETVEYYSNRLVRGGTPYENEFAEREFLQSEYSNYEYRYLLPREYRTRYRLFDKTISECVNLIVRYLWDGYSVIFNARNIEKQDRISIYQRVKGSLQARIETEFLEEFNLYADETRSSLNRGSWTNEQREEYNRRIQELKGVIFRNKVFYPDDLLTKEEKDELKAAVDLSRTENQLTNEYDIALYRVRDRLIKSIKERLKRDIISHYNIKYLSENETFYYSDRFLGSIIDAQLQRFGIILRRDYNEFNNIFINEDFILI
jgi:hypothetical protein